MICTDKDPPPNINIPVVMVSKSAGAKLRAADESQLHGDHTNPTTPECPLLLALVFPCTIINSNMSYDSQRGF
jgi:hypothetical protein